MGVRIYLRFVLIFFATTIAACSGQGPALAPSPPPPALTATPEPVTITWGFWGDPWEIAINDRVIDVFEADHPHIRVETFHRPWNDYFTELRPRFEQGQPTPDVLFWSQPPIDIPKGYFMNLTPRMEAENYDLNDFFSGPLSHFQSGDRIYGLPRDSDTKVIFYNKRLFNQADLPYPHPDWTWNDLRTISLQLKEAGVADYSFAYETNTWWMIWMWQNGVQIFDDKLAPARTNVDNPAAIEAVQFLADLTNVDQVTPPYETLRSSEEIATLFQKGDLAMAFGNHALVPAFTNIREFEWDVVGLPQQKRSANVATGAGYVIAANTDQPEAAWTFFKFLSSAKGQALFAESQIAVPARRSVARSPLFIDPEAPYNAHVFLEETEIGEAQFAFPGANEFLDLMNNEVLPPVWRGEQAAARAIPIALPRIEAILADAEQVYSR